MGRLVDEEVAGDALAEQAPLHVGEAGQHGVDRPGGDLLLQRLEIEIAAHFSLVQPCDFLETGFVRQAQPSDQAVAC